MGQPTQAEMENAARVNAAAMQYVTKSSASPLIQGQLASLSPEHSRCAFLRVEYIEHAGLGHTLSCWAKYLLDGVNNGLTYVSPFFSGAHENCNLGGSAEFYGIHSAFYWANVNNMSSAAAETVTVGDDRNNPCTSQQLRDAVDSTRRRKGGFSCDRPVVFLCRNEKDPFTNRESKSVMSWIEPVRGAVLASLTPGVRKRYRHPAIPDNSTTVNVVVHIRRGDILTSRRVDREHRLTSWHSYRLILRLILAALREGGTAKQVAIFILCEGAKDAAHIVEYDQSITAYGFPAGAARKLYPLDVQASLADVCSPSLKIPCSVRVLHDATSELTSFLALCEAHVLVSSTSGFSLPPSAICQPMLTVALPFSLSWVGIRNTIPVRLVSGELWKEDAVIELPGLANLSSLIKVTSL